MQHYHHHCHHHNCCQEGIGREQEYEYLYIYQVILMHENVMPCPLEMQLRVGQELRYLGYSVMLFLISFTALQLWECFCCGQ